MDEKLLDQLRQLLERLAKKINRGQFHNEPNYTAAFFGSLSGERIEAAGQYIEFKFSISDDRGPSSAEKHTGIDIGMVFEWETEDEGKDESIPFQKAVLVQAKNHVQKLANDKDLQEQCRKMRQITTHYIVLDCPYDCSIPNIYFSSETKPYWDFKQPPISLYNYLVNYVFQCRQGDTDENVIKGALDAKRTMWINTNAPKHTLTPDEPNNKPKNPNSNNKTNKLRFK